ncbi:MAG TPA: Crp/Fnr family transcriptional regulator [Actinomycetota bacterium]
MAVLSTAPTLDLRSAYANRMLASLSPDGQERLLRDALTMLVQPGDILYDPAETTPWVFFPLTCVVSILTVLGDGTAVETATIGREGMVGTFQALGDDHNPNGRAVIQMGGTLLRVDAEVFRHQMQRNPLLADSIERYVRALVIQLSQSVACGAAHSVRERLARWLLQTSDRVSSDDVRLTHEFLAHMLHARRASVTVALRELQDLDCVTTRRGGTTILDRGLLQAQACECYDLIRSEYSRLIPGEPPPP